jgi:hypothetical protein
MRALRARVTYGPAWAYAYFGGLAGVGTALALAIEGSWVAATGAALFAAILLWLARIVSWPFGETAHLRRVGGVIREANAAFNQARVLDAGPRRKSLVASAAEREARRLRRLRPPAAMASEHAELVSLAEQQAEAVERGDRAELEELARAMGAVIERWRGRLG